MLRILHESDMPDLLKIEKLTQGFPWTEETFIRCFQVGYPGWAIEENNNVVGYIITSFQIGEAHILNLCVHPSYQRRGYGQELLEYILGVAKSKGGSMAYLEVRRSNKSAIALYEKLGFNQIGERKNYYLTDNSREDALVFAKDLTVD